MKRAANTQLSLDSVLAEVCRGDAEEDHLDDATVASFLDQTLSAAERPATEAHLASCAQCREWARLSAEAIDDGVELSSGPLVSIRPQGWGFKAAALALAAALLVTTALGIYLLRRTPAYPELETAGVERDQIQAAGSEVARIASRGLEGDWPSLTPFLGLDEEASHLGTGPEAIVRDLPRNGPVPLSPRWSAVAVSRPDFEVLLSPSVSGRQLFGGQPTASVSYRLLIIDRNENLLTTAEGRVTMDRRGILKIPYPTDQEALPADQIFAWTVSLDDGIEPLATPWIPSYYHQRDASLEALLERSLHPILRASVLAAHGYLDPALAALVSTPNRQPDARQASNRLALSILEQKRLPETVIESELARLEQAP